MNDFLFEPNHLNELYLNNNIKNLLFNFINLDNINILLYGDSGTCKTTILKCIINDYFGEILDINKEKNILIINNLKEQSIHNFRHIIKSFCKSIHNIKKKIVLIDDIDLLCSQNQQMIKHCIDEYGKDIFFLMSCTNIQKVNDNLQSRTNIIKTNKLDNNTLREYILNISKKININFNEFCIDILINSCENSIKILNNNLKKIIYLNEKTNDNIKNICYNINDSIFDQYTKLILNKNIKEANDLLLGIYNNGFSVNDILENYFYYIKITKKLDENIKLNILQYICKYINIFYNIHEEPIELLFFTNNLSKNIK